MADEEQQRRRRKKQRESKPSKKGDEEQRQLTQIGESSLSNLRLDDDVIVQEILTRLPIKPLVAFSSVSKAWYSTLTSHEFAATHLEKSPYNSPSSPIHSLLIEHDYDFYRFTFDNDHLDDDHYSIAKLQSFYFDYGDGYGNSLQLTSICDGLICLTPTSHKYFVLWNPATRKQYKYNAQKYVRSKPKSFVCGFGYSTIRQDYLYVKVICVPDNRNNTFIYVFSLGENKWRNVDFDPDLDLEFTHRESLILNEKLYWRASSKSSGSVIVSFDIGLDKVEMFPFSSSRYRLGAMGDRLCTFGDSDNLLNILEPPKIVKSIKLPAEINIDWSSDDIIGLTRTGKFFVTGSLIGSMRRRLMLVDLGTAEFKTLFEFNRCEVSFKINIARYVPSLVSPFPLS